MNNQIAVTWPRLRAILSLERAPFEAARSHAHGIRRGVMLIVAVTLLAGLLTFLFGLFGRNQAQADSLAALRASRASVSASLATAPPDVQAMVLAYFDQAEGITHDLAVAAPRLPRPLADFLQSLGHLLSQPLARLGSWLAYTLCVLLFARLLGGQGSLSQTLSATALYVVPHLLNFFAPVTVLGTLLGFIAALWGLAIYVRAVQVSQRFTLGNAVLVTILPAAIVAVLLVFAVILLIIVIALTPVGSARSFMLPGIG